MKKLHRCDDADEKLKIESEISKLKARRRFYRNRTERSKTPKPEVYLKILKCLYNSVKPDISNYGRGAFDWDKFEDE